MAPSLYLQVQRHVIPIEINNKSGLTIFIFASISLLLSVVLIASRCTAIRDRHSHQDLLFETLQR